MLGTSIFKDIGILMLGDHSSITSAKRWVGGGGQLLTFADKVGGWGWPNADVSKK